MRYVVGLLFSDNLDYVLLIEKKRPTWQAGKLNGVGGKAGQDEGLLAAMMREFKEETGVHVDSWKHLIDQRFPGGKVAYFIAKSSEALDAAKTVTDEELEIISVAHIINPLYELIEPLQWIIPMGIYSLQGKMDDTSFTIWN